MSVETLVRMIHYVKQQKLDSRVVKKNICIADVRNRKALCQGKDFKSIHHSPH